MQEPLQTSPDQDQDNTSTNTSTEQEEATTKIEPAGRFSPTTVEA